MEINLVLGIDTKKDAINSVLNAIGSVGINSDEEIDWNIDAADADKLIDNLSQKIQTNNGKGWWFNREEFHKLTPDPVTGGVAVPNNTLSCYVQRVNGALFPITLRGTKLFDAKNLGYDVSSMVDGSGRVPCTLVVNLPFDELPSTAKHAITDAARFWFVNDKEGDQIKMNPLQQSANMSFAGMMSEDASQKRRNMFNNKFISNSVMLAGGYNNVR